MGVLQDLETLILPVDKLNDDGCPTASIAILEDGAITAHIITGGSEDTETVYQACSISKAITGLAVARLVDMKHISYDTKVAQYLPQSIIESIVNPATEHMIGEVTVAMLLSHTAGLSQHGFPGYAGQVATQEDTVAGRAPSNTPRIVFNSMPGIQCAYSGGGFVILQVALEQLMSKPFAQLMFELVLEPLGMKRSWYTHLPPNETNYARAHSTAYVQAPAPYHRFVELAAAGLWTTPTDLLRAVSAIQNSLTSNDGFLKLETAKILLTEVGSADGIAKFGMGWAINDQMFGHAGDNWPGYMSYFFGSHGGDLKQNAHDARLASFPKYGVAVMINSVSFKWPVIRRIVSAIFHLKGWPRYYDLPGFGKDEFAPFHYQKHENINSGWEKWLGKWEGGWELVNEEGPKLKAASGLVARLRPAAAPVRSRELGEEFVFTVDGLKFGMRLSSKDGEEIVETLGANPKLLKRNEMINASM